MKWLIDCADVAVPSQSDLPELKPPARGRAAVPIEDNGEKLVSLSGIVRIYPVYYWMGFKHAQAEPRVRADVARRLQQASASLPPDFEIVVIDGHRTRQLQAELMTYYKQQTEQPLEGYVSDPDSTTLIPPHATGGAVDLTLAWRGAPLGLGTDFDEFSTESAPASFESVSSPSSARDLRRLLAKHLMAEGIGMVVIDSEWWHWSYGDQWWAVQTGAPAALYGEAG
jgi:zinc D-Ala-D-Ala dipeptidase